MTGEQTGLSGNHDNRKADPMSEAFCSTGVQTAFSEEGRWGFGKPGEAQDASSGTNSGQVKIPSDFLNERKLSERDNKGNDKEKPAGSFCPPSEEEYLSVPSTQTNHRKATVTETSAISSVQRRRWQSEPSLGFRYRVRCSCGQTSARSRPGGRENQHREESHVHKGKMLIAYPVS